MRQGYPRLLELSDSTSYLLLAEPSLVSSEDALWTVLRLDGEPTEHIDVMHVRVRLMIESVDEMRASWSRIRDVFVHREPQLP